MWPSAWRSWKRPPRRWDEPASDVRRGSDYILGASAVALAALVGPCAMCRRLIINAGIAQVVCRTGADEYTTTLVRDWVYHDDSIG